MYLTRELLFPRGIGDIAGSMPIVIFAYAGFKTMIKLFIVRLDIIIRI
ncbi:hypothetical protein Curi_c26420 [Gottschalkia acidurici 9a]|uniref:Uncharacterized protein n=1 Tax=Gottschalkia acidurici (strain ATCC 7906 / DSM 604 / BCRC 14475 / CIP 104303 / KCTC 5404 / NCIMB 10678 / 9a) TaxID=1128398 RepID=K0B382_GOTA9|nr:hypothetical protein [Gottschalkia acidurici]AFS79637.1 hypothetical protein Curi_c26420 [Gottschalkia acidurici 9a]